MESSVRGSSMMCFRNRNLEEEGGILQFGILQGFNAEADHLGTSSRAANIRKGIPLVELGGSKWEK